MLKSLALSSIEVCGAQSRDITGTDMHNSLSIIIELELGSNKEVYWYNPIDFPFTTAACGSIQDGNSYDCICAIIGMTGSFWLKILNEQ